MNSSSSLSCMGSTLFCWVIWFLKVVCISSTSLTGVSTFLAPRVAFLAVVALTFGAVLAPPLVFFTGSSTVSSTLGVSTFSGDSFLTLAFLVVFAGVALASAAGAFWPLAFLGGLAASSASGTGEGSIFLFPRPPRVVFVGSGVWTAWEKKNA